MFSMLFGHVNESKFLPSCFKKEESTSEIGTDTSYTKKYYIATNFQFQLAKLLNKKNTSDWLKARCAAVAVTRFYIDIRYKLQTTFDFCMQTIISHTYIYR